MRVPSPWNHHNHTRTTKKRINDEKKLSATITAANMANINLLASAVLLQAMMIGEIFVMDMWTRKITRFAELRQFLNKTRSCILRF